MSLKCDRRLLLFFVCAYKAINSMKTNQAEFFCVRQVYLPTNLGACKPTFYTFYTSHQG